MKLKERKKTEKKEQKRKEQQKRVQVDRGQEKKKGHRFATFSGWEFPCVRIDFKTHAHVPFTLPLMPWRGEEKKKKKKKKKKKVRRCEKGWRR